MEDPGEDHELPVMYSTASLDFSRPLTWGESVRLVSTLVGIGKSYPWWVGSFFNYVSKAFPETWAQLIPEGVSKETLRAYMWVESRYPKSIRDLKKSTQEGTLPWSVYQAAAGLEEGARFDLVRRAAREGLTTGEVRALVRAPREEPRTRCPKCGWEW